MNKKNTKIVVIDDTGVVRMKVGEMLSKRGFEVLEAKDGAQGYQIIQDETKNISLIMLDFILPKMSGWEVFQQIQAQPDLQKIPLVIMSGRKEEVTDKIPEPFEKFEFLGKPFDENQLFDAIKLASQKVKKAQQSSQETATAASASAKSQPVAASSSTGSASAEEIKALNAKIAKMQTEIDTLKKQLTQVVTFIKQKIK